MNANTRLRLWKETRALLPMWAAVAALIALPFLLRTEQPMSYAIAAYWFGCAVLGPVCIGHEFQHRTMGLLLSLPVSRRRLWWEKMAVLGAAMVGLFAWMELLWGTEVGQVPVFAADQEMGLKSLVLLLLPLLVGFSSGPALALLARGTIGGVALTFLCPWFLFMIGIVLVPGYWLSHAGGPELELGGWIITVSFYCCVLFLFGCRRFQCLEDIQGRGQELSLPPALAKPFAEFTGRLTLGQGGVLGHLVRKEVRLHLPAFMVASGLVAMWLALVAVVSARPTVDKGFLMLPTVLLCLGIPVIAGIVSTAEERSLGLLDWHLTLPVSAQRQWLVKVLVAFVVNGVLGLLLPGLLWHAAAWVLGGERPTGLDARDTVPFTLGNVVIFCAALYASTASGNSMRALVGAIVLFLVGAMVTNLAFMTADWVPDALFPMPDRYGWWPAPELCQWAFGAITPLGWGFLVWFGALGLANFKRSMEAGWRPVRRLVPFVATIWLVLASVFTYHRMFSHYDWTYYEMNKSLRWDWQKRAKQRAAERGKLEVVPPAPAPKANPVQPQD